MLLGPVVISDIPRYEACDGRFIAAEAEKWSKVIRAANIKVD